MADDSVLLGQLAEEFSARVRRGQTPDVEDYVARHPTLAQRIRALFPTLILLEGMAAATSTLPDSGLDVGATFGGYRIEREVGRGGMGVVYEATHLALNRRVALKVLPIGGPQANLLLERFFREAQTAAALHHTNIVPVFDVGQVEGVPYYAMQYIPGTGLDRFCRPGALTAEHAVARSQTGMQRDPRAQRPPSTVVPAPLDRYRWTAEVGVQAAEGLAYAHARGVVHRDIKPSNLLVDQEGVVRITDFGLARRLDDAALTTTGQLVGTPRYMSPEQAAGRLVVDHATDVYSLGVTLYELLTFRPAFDGESPQEIVGQILSVEPSRPRQHDAGIPHDLETIVLKAMAKRPADRYATARDLGDDLRRFLATEPIAARRIGPVGRFTRWARRSPTTATLLLLVLLSLAAGTAVSIYFAVRAVRDRDALDAALRNTDEARSRADADRADAIAAHERERRLLYAARLNLARTALRNEEPARLDALLAEMRPEAGTDDLRGWEWHYLRRSIHADRRTTTFGDGPADFVAASDAAHRVAVLRLAPGGRSGELVVWDADRDVAVMRRQLQIQKPGQEEPIPHLRMSTDGRRVGWQTGRALTIFDVENAASPIAVSLDGDEVGVGLDAALRRAAVATEADLFVWELERPPTRRRIGVTRPVSGVAPLFAPNGKSLLLLSAAGAERFDVQLWDVDAGSVRNRVQVARRSPLAFSPDSALFAVTESDGRVRIGDVATGDLRARSADAPPPTLLLFTPDGKQLLGFAPGSGLRVWEVEKGREVWSAPEIAADVSVLRFTANGRYLAAGDRRGRVTIFDTRREMPPHVLRGHHAAVVAVAFPAGDTIITLAADGSRKQWLLRRHDLVRLPAPEPAVPLLFAPPPLAHWHDNGRLAIVAPTRGEGVSLAVFDAAGAKQVLARDLPGVTLALSTAPLLDADGRYLFIGGGPPRMVYVASGGDIALEGAESLGPVVGAAFTHGDSRLALLSSAAGGTLTFYEASTGRRLSSRAVPLEVGTTQQIAFSPDDRRLFVQQGGPGRRGRYRVWDLTSESAAPRIDQEIETPHATAIAFSRDSSHLAVALAGEVVVWNLNTGRREQTVGGYRDGIAALAFTPDARRLIVAPAGVLPSGKGDADVVHVWDVGTGQQLLALPLATDFAGPVVGIVFAGKRLVVTRRDRGGAVEFRSFDGSLGDGGEMQR
jgi:serine/threonine protein kinase/WD40 repeat protein